MVENDYLCMQYFKESVFMASFIADKIVMDGLTFDDVLLIPAYSEVLPKTVELKTRFSRNIELNIQFVTALPVKEVSVSFIRICR